MINFSSLQSRIFAGFLLLIFVIFFLGIFSYYSLSFSQKQTEKYVDARALVGQMLELDKLSISLNRFIDYYGRYGYENTIADVEGTISQMRELLAAVNTDETAQGHKDTVERMAQQLDVLDGTFKDVVLERNIRSNIVTQDISNVIESLQSQLNLLARDFGSESESVFNVIIVIEAIEKSLYRYMDYYDHKLLDEIEASFDVIEGWIKENESLIGGFRGPGFVKDLRAKSDVFENQSFRLVQSIRSNLFLENVVMAGACYEILYLSRDLNNNVIAYSSQLTEEIQKSSLRDRKALVVVAIAFFFTGIVISIIISRSVTRPIVSITETFNQLAKGEVNTDIPARDRLDEIGALARSADVFKAKNAETEKLLKSSREMAEKLEVNQEALEKSNDELEQFVYTVSHDLKSPLVTSSGFITMIQDLYKAGKPDKAFEKLDKVIAANERMGQLINDLLELSRVGRVDLDLEKVDLNLTINEFLDVQKEVVAKEKVEVSIDQNLPEITANKSRVLQVLENLFTNSIKYRGTDEFVKINIGFKEDSDGFSLYFKDNGRGIAPEFHKKIFGLFSRLDNDKRGNGIGLAIVQKTMQFHGGKVWVESKLGEGSCFWLYFPQKDIQSS